MPHKFQVFDLIAVSQNSRKVLTKIALKQNKIGCCNAIFQL